MWASGHTSLVVSLTDAAEVKRSHRRLGSKHGTLKRQMRDSRRKWTWRSSLPGNGCKLLHYLVCSQASRLSSSTRWAKWLSMRTDLNQIWRQAMMKNFKISKMTPKPSLRRCPEAPTLSTSASSNSTCWKRQRLAIRDSATKTIWLSIATRRWISQGWKALCNQKISAKTSVYKLFPILLWGWAVALCIRSTN